MTANPRLARLPRLVLGLFCAPAAGVGLLVTLYGLKGDYQMPHDSGMILHFLAVCYLAELVVGVPTHRFLIRRGLTGLIYYVAFGLLDAWIAVTVFAALMEVADSGKWSALLSGLPEAVKWMFHDRDVLTRTTLFGLTAGSVFWVISRPDR